MKRDAGRRAVELRRSNAAGSHGDRRLRRLRTKASRKKQAIRDSKGTS